MYVNLKLTYIRGPSRTLPNISRTLSGSKISSRGIRPDLTYDTVHLMYVNHPETHLTYFRFNLKYLRL